MNLPWTEMSYKDGHLFTDTGKVVKSTYRFTSPELEKAFAVFKAQLEEQGTAEGVQIPDLLLGGGDGELGPMFKDFTREEQRELIDMNALDEDPKE